MKNFEFPSQYLAKVAEDVTDTNGLISAGIGAVGGGALGYLINRYLLKNKGTASALAATIGGGLAGSLAGAGIYKARDIIKQRLSGDVESEQESSGKEKEKEKEEAKPPRIDAISGVATGVSALGGAVGGGIYGRAMGESIGDRLAWRNAIRRHSRNNDLVTKYALKAYQQYQQDVLRSALHTPALRVNALPGPGAFDMNNRLGKLEKHNELVEKLYLNNVNRGRMLGRRIGGVAGGVGGALLNATTTYALTNPRTRAAIANFLDR